METNRPHITPQGFIGVFIVLLGIVFTLDNLGLVESREVLQYWPLAPLGIGLLIVIHANETRDWIRGSIWLGAGALLLSRNLGWLHFRIEAFWPLLMVFFGLHIIFKAREDPADQLERRANRLRDRQDRWHRRMQRQQERRAGKRPAWPGHNVGGDWGAEWTKQWTEKWGEAQAKFQEDWHDKFHEKFDRPIDVDVHVDPQSSPQPQSSPTPGAPGTPPMAGTSAGVPTGATANAAAAGSPSSTVASGSTGSAGSAPYTGTGYASTFASADPYDAAGSSSSSTSGYGASAGYGQHKLSMFALMSGVTRRIRNAPFFGANMTAVMGGIELDLRQAQLPEDAVIELFAFWGGIEIWVPREWSVVNQGFALMGSIEDKTGNLPQRPGQPRLVLRGMALMGGVEIKN
jgi:hypothetical protein